LDVAKARADFDAELAAVMKPDAFPIQSQFVAHTIRKVLPENGLLVVDAGNGGKHVRSYFKSYEPGSFYCIDDWASVGGSLPIALGEHVYTTHAFRDYIENNAVDVVQVDVCRVGGITPWMEVAALANVANLRVCPHAGDLMQVHQHLVKAIPNNWLLEVIPIWNPGPFSHPIQLRDGYCLTPGSPGASTDFTDDAMEKFRVS